MEEAKRIICGGGISIEVVTIIGASRDWAEAAASANQLLPIPKSILVSSGSNLGTF